jgi:hypothetical protein
MAHFMEKYIRGIWIAIVRRIGWLLRGNAGSGHAQGDMEAQAGKTQNPILARNQKGKKYGT